MVFFGVTQAFDRVVDVFINFIRNNNNSNYTGIDHRQSHKNKHRNGAEQKYVSVSPILFNSVLDNSITENMNAYRTRHNEIRIYCL